MVEPLARDRRADDDGGGLQRSSPEGLAHVFPDQLDELRVDEIGLGHDDEPVADVEEVENGEVFPRLGHDAFVGGHGQEGEVDAPGAGQHILDEALVPGDINDAHLSA